MKSECLCQKCGKEIPYWQAHGQPITFIGGFAADLCPGCRNALTKAIYEDPDGWGRRYAVGQARCEAAEHGGDVKAAGRYEAIVWDFQERLFYFVERWIAEGKGPANADADDVAGTR